MPRFRRFLAVTAALAALAALPLRGLAQEAAGSITGRVVSAAGAPTSDAQVTLVELRRRTAVDADGRFAFHDVPAGTYLLEIVSARSGSAVRQVAVTPGAEAAVEVALDQAFHADEVVVTVSPDARGVDEVYQPVDVVSGDELAVRREATLGETLSNEPGVTSTYFGPGASRPIIRGMDGDRIRVLESGIGTGDASSTSPDHAVSVDPLSAETIEIVRGPATLLYGGSAVGGVVNVIDGRIPDVSPGRPVTGRLDVGGGTVADELRGALVLDGALGPNVAWHGEYLRRDTDDYDIPGFAALAHEDAPGAEPEEREEPFGVLPNSSLESEGGSVGLSWVGDRGFLGGAWTGYDTFYGIPAGAHEHHEGEEGGGGEGEEGEEEEEAPVRIDLQQRRVDVQGELSAPTTFLRGLRGRVGVTDYEHVELEGAEVGTRFTNDYWEGRLDALHVPLGPLTGSVGVQLSDREFVAVGEEAFLPPNETSGWALFAFEELGAEPLRFQAGVRYESQDAATDSLERSLEAFSVSGGAVWQPSERYAVALSLTRAERVPTAEELFANGPHVATNAFEIGDPDLHAEASLGADLSLRRVEGALTGELNLFVNRFDDFIFEVFTDEEEDGLPVLRTTQADAVFLGGEAHADLELWHAEPHHLALELTADVVRAELVENDEPLPRIPPLRAGAGLHYRGPALWGRIEGRLVSEQDRVAPFEEPTDGYGLLNAALGYRFFLGGLTHDLLLRGTNLTDEEAREHTSFLKDVAPLPGRDFSLTYRLFF